LLYNTFICSDPGLGIAESTHSSILLSSFTNENVLVANMGIRDGAWGKYAPEQLVVDQIKCEVLEGTKRF